MGEHPISLSKAKDLLSNGLADEYRRILAGCCVPIFWFNIDKDLIAHNGTLTIVETPKKLLGITAAHVFRRYETDLNGSPIRLQLMNEVIDDLHERVIDVSDELDIATFALDERLVKRMGTTPLGIWPPKPPQEGTGIMIAGYPALERIASKGFMVKFGRFTALGVARTVTEKQITWLIEPEHHNFRSKIPFPPRKFNFGGISGGPLISCFESENYVCHFRLSGIVIEHPNYQENLDFPAIERLIAIRADSITESGRII